ncbi:unnamed protein product [Effrenium voratum]|uniref:Uncharacterized protein n=1 Tax=Effrenium voratum TaxID=2562239 RepID=A0AA36JKX1_9DINO|nr:unnamed protein product [Effrenium voratum]CAJ1423703.1 unnamed protein product [Effrenium voratum]
MPAGMPANMGAMGMGSMGMMPNAMPMMGMGMSPAMPQMNMPMMGNMGMPMMPNPMMMMMANAMAASRSTSKSPTREEKPEKKEEKKPMPVEPVEFLDPDVRKLGDHFNIEDRWLVRLDELMRRRKDTKEQDLAKLYEVLEQARSPTGLLVAKLGEMECGQFVGKVKPDRNIERLATRYSLDTRVVSRLTELRVRRKKTQKEDFDRLEQHLSLCKRPSATATLLIGKVLEGELKQIPDVTTAKALAQRFKLDKDAKSKLREIAEKRAEDVEEVMGHLEKTLLMSHQPSATLCKLAKTLMDGGKKRSTDDKYTANSDSDAGSDVEDRQERQRSRSPARSDCSTDSSSIRRRKAALEKRSRSRDKKGKGKQKGQQKKKDNKQEPAPKRLPLPTPGTVQKGGGSGGWTVTEW